MGETGPCGPCSEILLDQGPGVGCGRPECAPGCECDRYLEIWNLVFTQFDRQPDGGLIPLPKPNIDTGMGLERLSAVVQGVFSNYDTDLFSDIMARIQELSGKRYGEDSRDDVSFRVIADHARAATFLIGDGIMPSNEGRGYVLRRIIRRALRFGQAIGIKGVFLRPVCSEVIGLMAKDYPDLLQSRSFVEGVVENEEQRFSETLYHAMSVVNEEVARLKADGRETIPGELAFKLYDTYGFSLDILEDVAREEQLRVDREGYERAMSRQRQQSQESWRGSGEQEIPEIYRRLLSRGLTSRFVGYGSCQSRARIAALIVEGTEREAVEPGCQAEVILDETPFYGRAGGQAGDVGLLLEGGSRFRVTETVKIDDELIVHRGTLEAGALRRGEMIEARVDEEKRNATALNHSATHLLHAALRQVLGDHVKQAGSLVAPERLRFDFSHFAQVRPESLQEVELLVNRHIRANLPVETLELAKEEAFRTGAMAIFEERYGDRVRLVRMGEGVSLELCGGTHTGRTGDIGLLRILAESAVAANIRRIEALTGEAALRHDQEQDQGLRQAAALLKTTPEQLTERVKRLLWDQREKDREIVSLKAKLLSEKSEDLLAGRRDIGGISVVAMQLEARNPKELRDAADRIKDRLGSGIVLAAAGLEGKAMLTCIVTRDLTDRFQAGSMVSELSRIVGGQGGGRPDMAQGGGSRPERIPEAIEAFYGLIEKQAV